MNAQEHDPILAADRAEEMEARMELRRARTKEELATAWFASCDHFEGDAWLKLQAVYTKCLRKLGALHG
jgi:hypothetical protein